ncbi:hypothetical protein [Fodinibius sediminis]|uniref:YtxH-like protein n=1 Tax=Fodinibius sediminis TaxID=1214077 RepID=A0A521D490_9BACT|nr:hypothetical protein [Fodinibius sediminis]SMO66452.1 hypothetical protein SAMN06265218_108116 [Fodinibius sediminis]
MKKKAILQSLLLATGSFVGGMTLGLLLTPTNGRQNRMWISEHAAELAEWAEDRRRNAEHKGQLKLRHIRRNVHEGLSHHIPDLYEATEDLDIKR